ncbi:MAG: hypothetical protein KatS3mg087_1066 [Patescibacteria group bacterium]|nr:MAG: hypothetical protein KatS3mg087_1066 [Patescibacteria group bacterium]
MDMKNYIEPIEAPVKGLKVFGYDFNRGLLSSPVMSTYWLPNDNALYTGDFGLFFWAVPDKLIAIAEPPTSIGLAIVEVVPYSYASMATLVPSPMHAISPNPFSNFR